MIDAKGADTIDAQTNVTAPLSNLPYPKIHRPALPPSLEQIPTQTTLVNWRCS
jgi:hypothetical protein